MRYVIRHYKSFCHVILFQCHAVLIYVLSLLNIVYIIILLLATYLNRLWAHTRLSERFLASGEFDASKQHNGNIMQDRPDHRPNLFYSHIQT